MKSLILLIVAAITLELVSAGVRTNNIVHYQTDTPWNNGVWRKKMIWKPRWVKSWQEKKVYVAVWKRVWGPVELNEWVPLPKPPPGWAPPIKTIHHQL